MDNENQTIKQKMMIVSAQYSDAVLELLKSVIQQRSLIGDTEYATVVNAVTFDVQSEMLLKVSQLMEQIKSGSIINNQ